jgi:rhamnosyltransferase
MASQENLISSASLIVRTFNEGRYLDDVLSAARKCGPMLLEVIVVDSGSTDGTLAIAESHSAKIVTIEKKDFSFGRSLNKGCSVSRGEVVVFLSGHCILCASDWLTHLLAPFNDPQVAVSYGRQIGGAESKFSEKRVFYKYYPPKQASQGPTFCNNANAAVRKSIWNRFKYNEDLTGLEDMEMGRKVTEAGFRIAYSPEAVVTHLHHESWPQVRRRYEREAIALRHIHPDIHLSTTGAVSCFLAACFYDIREAIKLGKSPLPTREVILYRFQQFYGGWLGSRTHRELSSKEKTVYFFPA